MDNFEEFIKNEQMGKIEKFRYLNESAKKGETLFTGSSLMEHFPINELLMDYGMDNVIYNRGVGGFKTDDMLEHMEEQVFGTEPSKIFINIGTNDIGAPGYKLETLMEKYEKILTQIKEHLPETEVYMMAYYPVNEVDKVPEGEWGKTLFITRTNENIALANKEVEKLAEKMGYHYIDVSEGLRDENGRLKKEFTIEGIHMYANGYRVILENMKPYL
ncbi:MAG TPA: lysophospholipase [Lachnospiraceae bacterium]|nr:lysophospholipase [Lachnospiraceae bacterium]